MKNNKMSGKMKVLCTALSAVLVLGVMVGVTFAYYSDKTEPIVNQFTVGNVTTELVEDFFQPDSGDDTNFTKKPSVVNTGANDCIVRMRVNITPESLKDKDVVDKDGKVVTDEDGKPQKYLVISGYDGKWIDGGDGFYYYNEILKPGEATTPLFTTVDINYDEYNPWIDFDIVIYQEAVQAEVKGSNGQIIVGNTLENRSKIWECYDAGAKTSN